MTVTTSSNKTQPLGNGVTTSFPFAFRIFAASDLVVTNTNIATGVDTPLVLNTDYTVTGVGSYNGGNVVFGVAPVTGVRITIRRVVSITQQTDLRNNGAYFAESHEDVFDRSIMVDQQQQEVLDRSLTLAPTSSGVSAVLPNPIGSQVLAWNPAGTALVNVGPVDNTLLAVQLADNADAAKGTTLIGHLGGTLRAFLTTLRSNIDALAPSTGATLIGAAGGLTVQTALNAKAALAGLLTQVFRVANAVGVNDAVPLGQADARYMAIAAGLNFGDVAPIAITTVHTNSVAGKFLYINAAGATTQTFPVANTMAKGQAVAFQNYGAGIATFSRQGTDTLFGIAGGVSVALSQGDTIIAVSDAGGTMFCHVVRAVGANAGPTMVVFTTNGTYTKPAGLKGVRVRLVGGGGGGGTASGGGGGYSEKLIQASTLGATETVTIGAGGNGTASIDTNGGTTSFGAHCSATGGTRGAGAGAGGIGSGGNFNVSGGSQSNAGAGASMLGLKNQLYGGGGDAGINGSPGVVIIEEYY